MTSKLLIINIGLNLVAPEQIYSDLFR